MLLPLREHALNNLAEIAKTDSVSIEAQILPTLFQSLPDRAPTLDEEDARLAYRRTLACLGVLAVEPALFTLLVELVLSKLRSLSAAEKSAEAAVYAFALLVTVEKLWRKKAEAKHTDLPSFADRLLPSLFAFFVQGVTAGQDGIAAEPRLIVVGGKIVELVVQSLPVECVPSLSGGARFRVFILTPTVPVRAASKTTLPPSFKRPSLMDRWNSSRSSPRALVPFSRSRWTRQHRSETFSFSIQVV